MTALQKRIQEQTKRPENADLIAFEKALGEQNCLREYRSLVDAQCSPEWLMHAVGCTRTAWTHHSNLRNDPGRMNLRKLKTLLDKTRWVAQQWEQQFQTDFGKEVLRFAGRDPFHGRRELLNTPSRLLALAKWASDIQRGNARHRRPLLDDCLAQLVETPACVGDSR